MHALTNMCYGFCARKGPNDDLIDQMYEVIHSETKTIKEKTEELEELSKKNRDELMKLCTNTDYKNICDGNFIFSILFFPPIRGYYFICLLRVRF